MICALKVNKMAPLKIERGKIKNSEEILKMEEI